MYDLTTTIPAILFKLGPWTPDADDELPRQGFGYRPGLSGAELYDSVRAWWHLDRGRASDYRYAFAVHGGVTLGVWEIDHRTWREASPGTLLRLGRSDRRWAFKGKPAVDLAREFVGRRVPETRPNVRRLFGRGGVFAYWPE